MSRLETAAIVYDLPEALCLKSFLESRGIPTFINGLHHAQVNWWVAIALGGLEIRVPQSHADDVSGYVRTFRARPSECQSMSDRFRAAPIRNSFLFAFLFLPLGLFPHWARKRPWGERVSANISSGKAILIFVSSILAAGMFYGLP